MTKKIKKKEEPNEIPFPKKEPDINVPIDPEEPLLPKEDPNVLPDENPYETPPYEVPQPGEGP